MSATATIHPSAHPVPGQAQPGGHQAHVPATPQARSYYLKEEHHPQNGTMLGFWIYLMTDCLIFACLFAVHGVLGRNYAAGPTGADLFELPLIAVNTALLLVSSVTYGYAMLAMQANKLAETRKWLAITGLLGLGFLCIELYEFAHLAHLGAVPQRSAFLSSFFTLVGTHGLHVAFGIIWLVVLLVQLGKHGLTAANRRRVLCLAMFWHFLDVVWIWVFSFVYLIGSMQ